MGVGRWILLSALCGSCADPAAPVSHSVPDEPARPATLARPVTIPDAPEPEPTPRVPYVPRVDCQPIRETGFRKGKRFAITVVTIGNDLVEQRTADAYWAMREAAAADGLDMVIYSGFRTNAEQRYFYRCFRNCNCNGCSRAAKPGYSNHQSGYAVDIAMLPGVHEWLVANAERFGFQATVKSEPWHWEYRPERQVNQQGWPALCPKS